MRKDLLLPPLPLGRGILDGPPEACHGMTIRLINTSWPAAGSLLSALRLLVAAIAVVQDPRALVTLIDPTEEPHETIHRHHYRLLTGEGSC